MTNSHLRCILTCFPLIVFLLTCVFTNLFRLEIILRLSTTLSRMSQTKSRNNHFSTSGFHSRSNNSFSSNDKIRILLGILSLPDQYNRRHFLRLIYGTQTVTGAKVDVKFVFCNITKEEQKLLISLEIMMYDDIITLNCTENMNKGKTYTYFSTLPTLFDTSLLPYHYVGKADDDTYFRLQALVDSLRPLPRDDLYYGYVIPCSSMDPFKRYMSGMGYLVSWDIVQWIKDSDIPKKHLEGPEDKVFGDWMREGKKRLNRFNAKWSMYNYPEPSTPCTHELWPNTIAVHLLKTEKKWIETVKYFNVTRNLKPSKLYNIQGIS